METPIALHQPTLTGNELTYIEKAIQSGHVSASGPFSAKAAETLRGIHGAAGVFLTTSCTAALEMSAMLLGLKPGDVVIVPSFTFVSTALAFVRQGVKLRFADIERGTLGMDPNHVSELLDERVKAIVPVHYAGVACDMDPLRRLAQDRSIDLIEDNAHGLFAAYKGRPLGSFGRFSALSFHETKPFISGEGGALVVNREADLERAGVLYDKGTNRRSFLLGEVDKYTWVDQGSSFGMSDVLAAYLLAQLEGHPAILARRRAIWDLYTRLLAPSSKDLSFEMPHIPPDRDHSYHLFYLLLPSPSVRDRVIEELRLHGIQAAFHYVPLHLAPGAREHLEGPARCPITEEISGRLLRLPFHNALTDGQVERVARTFLEVLKKP